MREPEDAIARRGTSPVVVYPVATLPRADMSDERSVALQRISDGPGD